MKKNLLLLPLLLASCASLKDSTTTAPTSQNEIAANSVAVVVPYLDTVYFDFDKYQIKDTQKEAIQTQVAYISSNIDRINSVAVHGHTDERGSVSYNIILGQERADSVAKAILASLKKKVKIKRISHGKSQPVAVGYTEEVYAQNRRAETKVELLDVNKKSSTAKQNSDNIPSMPIAVNAQS